MRRILFLIVATLSAACLLAVLGVYAWLVRSIPVQDGNYVVSVEGPVNIHFDHRGRPFIDAESWEDAFFAHDRRYVSAGQMDSMCLLPCTKDVI